MAQSSIRIEFETKLKGKSTAHIVHISGKFDETNVDTDAPTIGTYLETQVQSGDAIIFNLQDLHYVNSKGMGAFAEWYMTLESKNSRMIMANMSDEMKEGFDMVSLLDLFEVFDTVDDAVASI